MSAQTSLFDLPKPKPRFDGADYRPERDDARLSTQFRAIVALMKDGKFRTLREISEATGYPEASISAQLRHARKPHFGSHTVNREYRGDGLYGYQLVVREGK